MKAFEAAPFKEKARLRKKVQLMLSKAEDLKKTRQAVGVVAAIENRFKVPPQTRQIPTNEKNILLRSSRLHGNVFPPWDSEPDPKEFTGDPFSDASEFSLSAVQLGVFAGWKRPQEILGQDNRSINGQSNSFTISFTHRRRETIALKPQHDYDLVQDITTDCSVVASLCAGMRHLCPGPQSILPALMFPFDGTTREPMVSANGKYVFRMYVNGCFRKVVIDDRLPSSTTNSLLYVVDRQDPTLIWPALMEKAYLKVRGGYDFPGSNSATDLCALTGWIPEQIFTRNDGIDWDQVWSRIKTPYDYGQIIITLGTGYLPPENEDAIGLAGEHDYAVMDVREETWTGSRRMLVKNPWCDGVSWKGVGSFDVVSHATEDHPIKLKPGSFWMSFHDVTQNFETIYLNWNPSIFSQRQDHHFVWQPPDPTIALSFAYQPQYSMTSSADGKTWVLLSRHLQDGDLEIMRRHRSAPSLAHMSSKLGYMCIYIYDNHGKRVELQRQPALVYRGHLVDSPQTLAPFEAKRGVKYTVVASAQDLPLPKYSFTLSFYSDAPLLVAPAEPALKHYVEIRGSWTSRTAGGSNADSATYLQNPQLSLALPKTGPLTLLLSTALVELPVHVDLVWAGGKRVTSLNNRDLVITSGEYQRGCVLAQAASVDAGTYTVVCSTFYPGYTADFTLRVGSDTPCAVQQLPADSAGRLRTSLAPLPFRTSDAHKKQRAAVSAARLTSASVVVMRSEYSNPNPNPNYHHSGTLTAASASNSGRSGGGGGGGSTPRSRPSVRVTLEYGTGPDKTVIASTDGHGHDHDGGEFFQEVGPAGLRTAEFDIDPRAARARRLWLVVEQMGLCYPADRGADCGGLKIDILSDGVVCAGDWEAVDD